jgi:type I restriction enzyme S subunit
MSIKAVRIGDLFPRIQIGGTPPRGNSNYFGGQHVWVSIRDMEGKAIITDSSEHISDAGVANSNCKLVSKGSLLFSFKLTVGRVAFAGVDLYTNEAIAAFDLAEARRRGISLDYLSLILPVIAKGDTTKNSMGAALLNKDKIANLEIPLPPIDDQVQISAHLKAQLAAVEEARQAAQKQAGEIKRLFPAILKDTFDGLHDVKWIAIGDLAKTTSGSTPSRGLKEYWEPPTHPWVKTGEVVFSPIYKTEEAVSERALFECSISLLPVGTVLVAMYGQGKTRGQSAVLKLPATTNQACFAILPNERFDPEYIQFWLHHAYLALRELSESRGGNQANLNGELLNSFHVPLLPFHRQKNIAAQLQKQLTIVDEIEAASAAQLIETERLPARLLAQAFNLNLE